MTECGCRMAWDDVDTMRMRVTAVWCDRHAEAHVVELEARVQALTQEADAVTTRVALAAAEQADLYARCTRLREALEKYGQHLALGEHACASEWPISVPEHGGACTYGACTCGLTAALRED